MSAGKGDSRRPQAVTQAEYEARWAKCFPEDAPTREPEGGWKVPVLFLHLATPPTYADGFERTFKPKPAK